MKSYNNQIDLKALNTCRSEDGVLFIPIRIAQLQLQVNHYK